MLKDLFLDENFNKDDLLVKSNHELKELLKIASVNTTPRAMLNRKMMYMA